MQVDSVKCNNRLLFSTGARLDYLFEDLHCNEKLPSFVSVNCRRQAFERI
jgi:hypothetical protein